MGCEKLAKKSDNIDYEASLKERFERWDNVFENGCTDPFWADGVNLNLIRTHITVYKQGIEREFPKGEYPEIYYRETPEKVDNDYIAKPDMIREKAKKTLDDIHNDKNLKYIKERYMGMDDKFLKTNSIINVVGYEKALEDAVAKDDLIAMRRMGDSEYYLDRFQECADKIAEYVKQEKPQMSLFDIIGA